MPLALGLVMARMVEGDVGASAAEVCRDERFQMDSPDEREPE